VLSEKRISPNIGQLGICWQNSHEKQGCCNALGEDLQVLTNEVARLSTTLGGNPPNRVSGGSHILKRCSAHPQVRDHLMSKTKWKGAHHSMKLEIGKIQIHLPFELQETLEIELAMMLL
jgi:hypothetical protein